MCTILTHIAAEYERTETSKVVGSAWKNSFNFKVAVTVVITGIVSLTSADTIVSLTLSSTILIIIAALTVFVGLALICDSQFMKKDIIIYTVLAIAIVTFSVMLPSNLNPVVRTAIIVMYTVLIIGLIQKPFFTVRVVSCIARKTVFIIVSDVIPILKKTVFNIVAVVISLVKSTIIITVTVIIPIVVSSWPLIFNFSAATAIVVHLAVIVVTWSFNLRNEVYYALLISAVIVAVSYWHQIDMEQIDNHDFYIIVFVAILLIFLGLSFDLRSRTKITIIVAGINIAILITNSMLMSTHFITQTSFTLIISCLCILLLVYKYKVIRYFLLVVLVLFVYFLYTTPSHSF